MENCELKEQWIAKNYGRMFRIEALGDHGLCIARVSMHIAQEKDSDFKHYYGPTLAREVEKSAREIASNIVKARTQRQ